MDLNRSCAGEAEFFLFLASPGAAQSPWVAKEAEWWLENRSARSFLIVLTDGNVAWDEARGGFNTAETTVLPPSLARVFEEEPLYTDLRWARSEDHLSLRHSRFRAAILELAATLLGRPKDELDGDDVRQYRRTRRIAISGISTLTALFVAAVAAAYLATQQSRLATSRALEARSEAVLPSDPELALLLAREATRFTTDDQAEYALRQAVGRSPQRTIHQAFPGRTVVAAFAASDVLVAAEPGKPPTAWSIATGQRLAELSSPSGDRMTLSRSADDTLVVVATDTAAFPVYDVRTWKIVATLPGRNARFSRDGRVLTATDRDRVRQWRAPSLEERKVRASLPEAYVVRDVSQDGSLLLLTEDQEVSAALVVEAESGRTLAKLPQRVLRTNAGFSPDDQLLVTETWTRRELSCGMLERASWSARLRWGRHTIWAGRHM